MRIEISDRFALPLGMDFAHQRAQTKENTDFACFALQLQSGLADPWLPLRKYGLGVISDANLNSFGVYSSSGFK